MVDMKINHPTELDSSTAGRAPLPRSATPSAWGINKLRGLDTIWKSQLKAPAPALNVHQVVSGLRQSDGPYHHLFYDFTVYANLEVFQARAMIDSGITWNLISQDVVKQQGRQHFEYSAIQPIRVQEEFLRVEKCWCTRPMRCNMLSRVRVGRSVS